MKFLYVCQHFNKSGYYILNHLLQKQRFIPVGVLLPKPNTSHQLLNDPATFATEQERYIKEVAYYNCQPLRFTESIYRLAEARGIPIFERETLKNNEAYEWLKSLDLDLIIFGGGWKELIPKQVIQLPRLGILNTHPSLLPKYKGTDVHRWQVYENVSESGITIHYMDETFDTGDILGQVRVEISPQNTPQILATKTGRAAGPLMEDILEKMSAVFPEKLAGQPQLNDKSGSGYYRRWRWEKRKFLSIDWRDSAEKISRFILACTQESYRYNGPFFAFSDLSEAEALRGREYLLRQAATREYRGNIQPGEILDISKDGILIGCGGGDNLALLATQIQPATPEGWSKHFHSEPAISARDFAIATGLKIGDRLVSVFPKTANSPRPKIAP